MNKLFAIIFLITLIGCAATKTPAPDPISGNWVPLSQEMGGKAMPRAFYEKQRLSIEGLSYTLVAESVDKGELNYANGRMDIYGKEGVNKGKHFSAIYKLEKGQLTICYNLKGDGYPEGFDTKGKALYFISVYTKL